MDFTQDRDSRHQKQRNRLGQNGRTMGVMIILPMRLLVLLPWRNGSAGLRHGNCVESSNENTGLRAIAGNCVESSNENTGLRAIASNIQRKCFVVNVRHHFHALTHLYRTYYFSSKRCKIDFHLLLSIFHSGSRMSHHGLFLIEPSAQKSDHWSEFRRTFSAIT